MNHDLSWKFSTKIIKYLDKFHVNHANISQNLQNNLIGKTIAILKVHGFEATLYLRQYIELSYPRHITQIDHMKPFLACEQFMTMTK